MKHINDRGAIKWTSLMLPEHVEMLNELYEAENKKKKLLLDEQQVSENNRKLQYALHHNLPVSLIYFRSGDYLTTEGKLKKIDALQKVIRFENLTEVKFTEIMKVNLN